MRTFLRLLFLFVLLLLTSSRAFAGGNNYYVSPSGNDTSGSGTLSSPWATIPRGVSVMNPGDTLFLRAGQYPNFTITKSGANNQYLTIRPYNSEKAIVSGGVSEGIRLSEASYVAIIGLEVKDVAGQQAGIFLAKNSTYNLVKDNIVHDNKYGSGVIIEASSYNRIEENLIYNNYKIGIKIRDKSVGNQLVGNTIYHHVGDPPHSDGISVSGISTRDTLVKNNTVYDNADDGIDTWDSSYSTIIGNIVYNHRGPGDGNGFKLGGTETGGHNTIIGNVSFNNKRDGFDSNHSGGNAYYHNVSYDNDGVGFEDIAKFSSCTIDSCKSVYIGNIGYNNTRNFAASKYTAVSHNNNWYSDTGGANVKYENAGIYSSLDAFFLASGNRLDSPVDGPHSSFAVNPKFTSVPDHNFKLLSSSPLINKGDASNPAHIAAIGVPDIGAYEFGGGDSNIPNKPGDLNGDGSVNANDYNLLVAKFGNPYSIFDYSAILTGYNK